MMANEREPITPEELEGFPARNNIDGAVEDRMLRAASTIRDLRERLAGANERYLADLNLESTRLQAQVAGLQTKLAEAEKRAVPEGWTPLCIVPDDDTLMQERAFSVERSAEPGNEFSWHVFFGENLIGNYVAYKTLADAIRAAESAAEEANHAD